MRAGKLRHRVSLQRPEQAQDAGTGAVTTTWREVARVWASIESLSVREFIAAQSGVSEVTARITIRHQPGIHAGMRIVHGGALYNIHGALPDPKSGREYLTLAVSLGVDDGGR